MALDSATRAFIMEQALGVGKESEGQPTEGTVSLPVVNYFYTLENKKTKEKKRVSSTTSKQAFKESLRENYGDGWEVGEEVTEEIQSATQSVEIKMFEFRKRLKEVKAYERKVKVDSENWDEELWESFEQSLKAPVTASNSGDLFEAVLKNKAKNVVDESANASKIRAEVIKGMDFSLFNKLL